jgi:hypothetical protein
MTRTPPPEARCCANCRHWHKREYIHCMCSGPWGGDIPGDPRCTFTPAGAGEVLLVLGKVQNETQVPPLSMPLRTLI